MRYTYGATAAGLQSGGSNNVTYGSSINIRGIGPFATLTLVDGHRVVPQGTTGFAVDPSVIPTIGLERVEIVADGSSAIYGSDAVAGVANLILRRNFEGLEASARYGTAKGYNEQQFGVVGGRRWDGGQLTIAYEYEKSSALGGGSRPFENNVTAFQGGKNLVTQCNPGTITVGGQTYAIPTGGVTQANKSALVAGTTNKCDNQLLGDILPAQEHHSFDFTFNQKVNDWVSVFADGIASKRTFKRAMPGSGTTITVPSTNAYFVLPNGVTATSESIGYALDKDAATPPFSGYSVNYSLTFGADVKLPYDWKFEADYMFGRDDDLAQQYGAFNGAALNTALASGNTATAFNPYGAGNSAAIMAPIMIGFTYQPGRVFLHTYEAKFDGPVFKLPGGEIRAAFGYEGQRLIVAQGQDTGTLLARVGANPPHRYRNVNSIYGEVLVPIVGPDNAIPGIRRLDIDIAGRQDRYSDVGSTSNPKFGLNWSPMDGVLVHATYGTSFRAPTISQIYGNSSALFVQNYADPTNGGAPRVGVALSGGNTSLKSETAKTYSVGVDYTPQWLPGAKASVTYFSVEYDGQVVNYLSNLNVLASESLLAGTGVITRNPTQAQVNQLIATYPVNAGVLPSTWTLFVDGRSLNLGKSLTNGIDFDLSYRVPTDHYGAFRFGFNGTYLTRYGAAISASAPLLDQLNTIQNPLRFRARGSVGWDLGGWSAVTYVNYLNGYTNNLATPVQSVSAYTTLDLHVSYDFRDTLPSKLLSNIRVGVDASNLFDTAPPFVNITANNNSPGGFDPNVANPIGRLISVSIDKRW